jgi:hypothetical protein
MPILASIGAGAARGFGETSGAASLDVDYLVVAGGGAGDYWPGGGAGGGGFRTSYPGGTKLTIKKGASVTVGNGATGGTAGVRGAASTIGDFLADGGGGGGPSNDPAIAASLAGSPIWVADGGSGGGGNHQGRSDSKPNTIAPYWGLGNTPGNFTPSEGNYGSAPLDSPGTNHEGSGGGGAGAVGNRATHTGPGGPGGSGAANSITGTSVTYAGGGGGGVYSSGRSGGSGGSGGGGAGGPRGSGGTSGTNGLGGGGGGGSDPTTSAGSGGNGIVYIRVPSADAPASLSVSPGTNSVSTLPPGDKLCTFTVSGTIDF